MKTYKDKQNKTVELVEKSDLKEYQLEFLKDSQTNTSIKAKKVEGLYRVLPSAQTGIHDIEQIKKFVESYTSDSTDTLFNVTFFGDGRSSIFGNCYGYGKYASVIVFMPGAVYILILYSGVWTQKLIA